MIEAKDKQEPKLHTARHSRTPDATCVASCVYKYLILEALDIIFQTIMGNTKRILSVPKKRGEAASVAAYTAYTRKTCCVGNTTHYNKGGNLSES